MKDPVNKNRVITSYFKCIVSRLLKLASKALTFLLRNLHKKHRHFCLHRLHDTKKIIHKMKTRWHKRFGEKAHVEVVATDVKEMFTNLDHTEIRKATMWLFEKIQHGSAKTTNVKGRHLRKRKILIKVEKLRQDKVMMIYAECVKIMLY